MMKRFETETFTFDTDSEGFLGQDDNAIANTFERFLGNYALINTCGDMDLAAAIVSQMGMVLINRKA